MISLFGCVAKLGVGGVERAPQRELCNAPKTLDFVKRIKSYDRFKLLVCVRQVLVTVFQRRQFLR